MKYLDKSGNMKSLLISFALFCCCKCYCQTYPESDFEKIPIPKNMSKEWLQLDTSRDIDFSVSIDNGKLQIKQYTQAAGKLHKLPDGMLLALNVGEWGGGLFYQPNDSTRKYFISNNNTDTLKAINSYYKTFIHKNDPANALFKGKWIQIESGNIDSVFVFKDSIFFFGGLAHMGTNSGRLYKLEVQNNTFNFSKLLDFDDAPYAISIHGDTIYMATYQRFYVIANWKKELVFDNLFWHGLHSNSVAAISNREIYVGMHGGYAKIDLVNKKLAFYRHKFK